MDNSRPHGASRPLSACCYATAKGYTVMMPPTPESPSPAPRYFASLAAAMAFVYSAFTQSA